MYCGLWSFLVRLPWVGCLSSMREASECVLLDFTHRSDIKRVTHPNQRAGGGGGGAATAGANVVDDHPICGRYDSRSVGWTTEERMGQRAKERKGK